MVLVEQIAKHRDRLSQPITKTTLAGEFQLLASPYGTFNQGGDVNEWNETVVLAQTSLSYRGIRGESFQGDSGGLLASYRATDPRGGLPNGGGSGMGFRVASVPEPGSLVILAGIAFTALLYWWRKRA